MADPMIRPTLILLCCLLLPVVGACREEARPAGVPRSAEYTGTPTWDGRWVDCESWEVGVTTRCSMFSGRDVERGEYVIDGRADFSGQLTEQATNESDPLRSFIAGIRYSGLLDADWVHTRDVHVRPLRARLQRGDGSVVISAVAERYHPNWRNRDLRALAAECSRHSEEPVAERLRRLLDEVSVGDDAVLIGEARRIDGSLTDRVEVSIDGRSHTGMLVGDCWIRVTSSGAQTSSNPP